MMEKLNDLEEQKRLKFGICVDLECGNRKVQERRHGISFMIPRRKKWLKKLDNMYLLMACFQKKKLFGSYI